VQVWHAVTEKERCLLPEYLEIPDCLAFSPDGRFIAVGAAETSVKVWDVGNQRLVVRLAGYQGDIRGWRTAPTGSASPSPPAGEFSPAR
jgi:WD40 repeat protein